MTKPSAKTTAATAAPAATPPPPEEKPLPAPVARRGINEAKWRTLMNNLYPGAAAESVMMVWDYCVARGLDPLKKPCHIVPMKVTDAKTGQDVWRDVVLPGIYEYRTTAMRTGLYMGHAAPVYGEFMEYAGVEAPQFCDFTVYRYNPASGQRAEFPVRILFRECVALKDGKANKRWMRAPVQMLTKCAEAAALRAAFPDELGGVPTVEEMEGHIIESAATPLSGKPRTSAPRAIADPDLASADQLQGLGVKLGAANLDSAQLCDHFHIAKLDELPAASVGEAIEWIKANGE